MLASLSGTNAVCSTLDSINVRNRSMPAYWLSVALVSSKLSNPG